MTSAAVADVLADARELMGACSVGLWDISGDTASPVLLQYSSCDASPPQLDTRAAGLISRAAHQSIGEICTDGDVITFAAAPIEEADAATMVLTASARRDAGSMNRDQLRNWLPRFGKRIATVRSLVAAQASAARAERHADLLLLTAAQLQDHRSVEQLGASLCSAASHMTSAKRVALIRWHATEGAGEVAYAMRGHLVEPGWQVSPDSQVGAACVSDIPVLIPDATERVGGFVVYGGKEPTRSVGALVIMPLRGADGIIGALVAEADAPISMSQADAKNIRLLGVMGAAALETVWEIEEINRRARTDSLTGLANRQQFEERLTRIVMETDRFGGSCALVVADIDRFKHVNDTYGHQAGDQLLVRVAGALQQAVRTVDLCARYGGEEMAVLLPQTDLTGACQLAERLRQAVAEQSFVINGREIPITISLGVAAYPDGAPDRDALFAAADRALYSAKRGGRNRVESSQ